MKNRLGEFIKACRDEKDLSLRQTEALTGISRTYLGNLEKGIDPRTGKEISPTIPTLEKIASGLDLQLNELIIRASAESMVQSTGRCNRSALPAKQASLIAEQLPDPSYQFNPENIRMVPVLGKIAVGEPCSTENDIEGWMPVDISVRSIHGEDLNHYYYLRIHGDSMEPMFNDHDLVLVKKGPVEDGEIAVVICNDGENCVRKIQYIKEPELLILISRNPVYPPITKAMDACYVAGKVVLRIGEPRW